MRAVGWLGSSCFLLHSARTKGSNLRLSKGGASFSRSATQYPRAFAPLHPWAFQWKPSLLLTLVPTLLPTPAALPSVGRRPVSILYLCNSIHHVSHMFSSRCKCWSRLNILQPLHKLWEVHKIIWASQAELEKRIAYSVYYMTVEKRYTPLGVEIYVLCLCMQLSLAVYIGPKSDFLYAKSYQHADIKVIQILCAVSFHVLITLPKPIRMRAQLIALDSCTVAQLWYSGEQNSNTSVAMSV